MRWNRKPAGLAAGAALALLAGCSTLPDTPAAQAAPAARALYFYPEGTQTPERQDRDRYECYRWAVRQTGTDPGMQALGPSAQRREAPVGANPDAVAAGAMSGAAIGMVTASPRNAGGAMVLGAIFGGLLASAVSEQQREAHAASARRADEAARQRTEDDFRRAMSACMAGRGYEVR
jgi:hypothetical protein